MAHAPALGLVQQVIFAPAGGRGKCRGGRHPVHLARLHARRVHHIARLKNAPRGLNAPALPRGGKAGHPGFQAQLRAVLHRVLGHGKGVFPGAHNGRAGRMQRPLHLRRKVRLQRQGLFSAQQRKAGHPIRRAVFKQLLQVAQLLVRERKHQAADLLVGHVQLRADSFRHGAAPHVQLCHQGARLGVVSRVQNGAVGLGGPHGHVVFRLQNQHRRLPPGQVVCGGRANHAAADDRNIYHLFCLPPYPLSRQGSSAKRSRTGLWSLYAKSVSRFSAVAFTFAETMNPSSTVV